jgi:hypothetical protein
MPARDETETWLRELKAADGRGRFTCARIMFAVMGMKPETDPNYF